MTPSARLQATFELLAMIETVARPADALVSGYFRARRYIGSKDREAVATLTYAVLRHHARLNWWLTKNHAETRARNRLLAYLRLVEGKSPNAIVELCDGKKFDPEPLTEKERKLLHRFEGHTLRHPTMPDAVEGECPAWAEASLRKKLGKNFAREMKALLEPAPLDLRVNPLKTTREKAFAVLKEAGLPVELGRYS
ncbi:MAG: rRNA cytosine-C5-methylase, partial [Alphaproteobacteria bacterium]|nr:rRNA cytosine-C5-methylase [Alphaproteobacteria bacterium]